MKNLSKHNLLYFFILSSFFCLTSQAQIGKTTVNIDPKIDLLLKEKRKINSGFSTNESYKIQIFYGNSDDSKKKLQEFRREFKEIDGTIVYTNPNFKVWVGNFETRLEVEKAMLEIKKKYPTALLIKPSKQ